MAEIEEESLPQVLLFKPFLTPDDEEKIKKFKFLKAWEYSMPTDIFLATHAQSITALLCTPEKPVTAEMLNSLPSLKCVVTPVVGVNHIDMIECRRRGIFVTNGGNTLAEDGADYAVGLLLDVFLRISAADRYVRGRFWPSKGEYPLGSKVSGKRIGIVGLGNFGSGVAKRLQAFGCSISYNSRKQKPSVSYPFYSNVYDLATNTDALIICCALTDETYHMVNKEVMLALGKEGVIINVTRGEIIDEKELVQCLAKGEIKGAGLDAFENEPNVPKELFDMDNVVLSSHKAVKTGEAFVAACGLVVANLEAFFENKPLLSLVKNDQ